MHFGKLIFKMIYILAKILSKCILPVCPFLCNLFLLFVFKAIQIVLSGLDIGMA